MLPITFDWAQISYIGSPLMTPFWAAANVVGGLILVMWIIAPIMCTNLSEVLVRGDAHLEKQTTRMRSTALTCPSCPATYMITPQKNTMSREF